MLLLSCGVAVAKHIILRHVTECSKPGFIWPLESILTPNEQDYMRCVSLENLHLLSASNSIAHVLHTALHKVKTKCCISYLRDGENTNLLKR